MKRENQKVLEENELDRAFQGITEIHTFASDDEIKYILILIQHIYPNERPDGYCLDVNNVLILEHFEFDASSSNRKGSIARKEISNTDKKCDEFHKSNLINFDSSIFRGEIKSNRSIEYYIKNVCDNFDKHYEKINNYKNNLSEKNIITSDKDVKMAFVIENTTLLHTITTEGKNIELCFISEFLDVFEKAGNVDYVFSISSCGNNKWCWFLSRDSLIKYREKQIKMRDIQLINSSPQIIDSSLVVSKF